MVQFTKVNMSREKNKDSACLNGLTSPVTWDSFITIAFTGKAPMCGAMDANTWGTGSAIKCMVAEFSHGEMAESIPANTVTTRNMATANSTGLTVVTIKENGRMASRAEKAGI